jgi:hypothetical protein
MPDRWYTDDLPSHSTVRTWYFEDRQAKTRIEIRRMRELACTIHPQVKAASAMYLSWAVQGSSLPTRTGLHDRSSLSSTKAPHPHPNPCRAYLYRCAAPFQPTGRFVFLGRHPLSRTSRRHQNLPEADEMHGTGLGWPGTSAWVSQIEFASETLCSV